MANNVSRGIVELGEVIFVTENISHLNTLEVNWFCDISSSIPFMNQFL